jgi:hypothetical protein
MNLFLDVTFKRCVNKEFSIYTYDLLAAGAAAFEVGFFDFRVWGRFWTRWKVF